MSKPVTMNRRWVVCMLIAAHAAVSHANGWSVDTLPDPRTNPLACGRPAAGWVCSPDGLMVTDDLSVIQGYISTIYAAEYPYSELFCPDASQYVPIELMAVIIDEVQGTGDVAVKVSNFAKGILTRFGVGSKVCGSGAVIVISVEDRQVTR